MAYRLADDVSSIQSTVFGQLEERSFASGIVEPKSEIEEELLKLLCETGHAERVEDASTAKKGKG